MNTILISVTEASRNFSDCVNRARYQGAEFVLLKGGAPVARIVPAESQPKKGSELAAALEKVTQGVRLSEDEARSWLHDLEQSRGALQPQVRPWRF